MTRPAQPEFEPVPLAEARRTFICRLPDSQAVEETAQMFERLGCEVVRQPESNTLIVFRQPKVMEKVA